MNSNVAMTTVNVVCGQRSPNANNDIDRHEHPTGPIVIPEWVLLANDTDPRSDRSTSPAVSRANNSGLASLSLATNPGSVTFTDTGTPGGTFTYTVSDGGTPQRHRHGECHGHP